MEGVPMLIHPARVHNGNNSYIYWHFVTPHLVETQTIRDLATPPSRKPSKPVDVDANVVLPKLE